MFPLSLLLQASVLGVLVASVNTVIIIPAISQIFVKNVNGLTQDFRFPAVSLTPVIRPCSGLSSIRDKTLPSDTGDEILAKKSVCLHLKVNIK